MTRHSMEVSTLLFSFKIIEISINNVVQVSNYKKDRSHT